MPDRKRGLRNVTAAAAVSLMLVAGCSSSKSSSTGSGGGSSGPTYTVGLLTDLTGLVASAEETSPLGVKAGVGLAAQEGYHIKYVVADTGSSPSGALTAAQRLVDQDHVFAVIALSGLTFGAAGFLTSHGIPVVGSASDGPEWITSKNMFSVTGTQDYTKVFSQAGLFLKLVGVTNLGSIGFSISPSSSDSAKSTAVSAEVAGVKVGYLNAAMAFGTTNVGPIVLAMKNAGVDGYVGAVGTNTSFAIVSGLRQQGVNLKGSILPTGYGGDLAQGGPGAEQIAQGLDFESSFEPVEMQTPATQRLQSLLKSEAGVTTDPTYAEYLGYVSVDALVGGLKAAGAHPTQASFINAMLGITKYGAAGLFGNHSVSFGMSGRGTVSGPDNCAWFTRYSGSSFHLIPGADPICGSIIPGKSV